MIMMKKNRKYIVGIDEVGRGPIAGPVTVCATLVPYNQVSTVHRRLVGIRDSKKISKKKREEYSEKAKTLATDGVLEYALASSSAQFIDRHGINFAIRSALSRALVKLFKNKERENAQVFLDGGLRAPRTFTNQETIIRGDEHIFIISVASVIAKVHRDKEMVKLARRFSDYKFHKNKGYGTAEHFAAIRKFGKSEIHRKTFLSKR